MIIWNGCVRGSWQWHIQIEWDRHQLWRAAHADNSSSVAQRGLASYNHQTRPQGTWGFVGSGLIWSTSSVILSHHCLPGHDWTFVFTPKSLTLTAARTQLVYAKFSCPFFFLPTWAAHVLSNLGVTLSRAGNGYTHTDTHPVTLGLKDTAENPNNLGKTLTEDNIDRVEDLLRWRRNTLMYTWY